MPARILAGLCPACLLAQGAAEEDPQPSGGRRFVPPSIAELSALFPQIEILELLGAGGMGAVYKARQPSLDRIVALKILPNRTDSTEGNFTERFNREARALARLNHPNIVAVHEFGQNGPLYYFLMEYVDGVNLRQLEQNRRLSPREALQLIPQVCDALQYAHDEGVVHRDIKPENMLVDRKGRVKIADFGLAKILDRQTDDLRLTVEGEVMGTPHYMAPEQIERPLSVDHRADIYSLGVVLYEMLTGDLPLGNFPPPSQKVQLDVRLDGVVLRALQNDPERRYQHASEVKSQMQNIAGSPPKATVPAPPHPMPKPAGEPRRFHRWAGFPVVSEYDGQREVHWNGTLGAIATALLTVSAGFVAVHAITGEGKIPGTLQVCMAVALLTVAYGVRKALRRPASAEPAPWWRNERLVFAVLPLFVVAWSLFQLHWLNPKIREWNGTALYSVTAEPAGTDGISRVTLPKGGNVEILAIGEPDAAPNQWWRPDGRVVSDLDYEVHGPVRHSGDATLRRRFLIRTTDLPAGSSGPFIEVPNAAMSSGGTVFSKGAELWNTIPAETGWVKPPKNATVRIGIAWESFRSIMAYKPASNHTIATPKQGDPRWNIQVHGATDGAGGAQITVMMPRPDRRWEFNLVAVDASGREHSHRSGSGSATPSGDDTVWTYSFAGLSLSKVEEFRALVRPVYWTEFRKLAIHPLSALPAAKALQFGPVTERSITGAFDLDVLQDITLPDGTKTEAAAARGADVIGGTRELRTLNLTCGPLEPGDWDKLSPQAAINRVYEGMFAPRSLPAPEANAERAAYAYRTREGGFGLLEITGADAANASITVRIKPIIR